MSYSVHGVAVTGKTEVEIGISAAAITVVFSWRVIQNSTSTSDTDTWAIALDYFLFVLRHWTKMPSMVPARNGPSYVLNQVSIAQKTRIARRLYTYS